MKKSKYFCLLFVLFFNLFFLPVKPDTIFEIGKDVFLNKAMCGSCHALSDAETVGQIGPNLNQIKPDMNRIMSAVINGIGVMPPFEDMLSLAEIEAVAHYVSISASE
jgi:mono/diheme cytochrome c family protein